MLSSTRSILVDLVISNHETDGHPAVKAFNANELRRYLEHCVVNDVTLSKHVALLKALKVKRPQLPTEIVNTTLNTGLDSLSNQELATLTLDHVALETLYETIDKNTPQAWEPAVRREGLKQLATHDDRED